LVVVPPWPFYNQHPETWFGSKSKGGKIGGVGVVVDGVKVA
jgi:signal peptidase complex subunit 1